MALNPNGTRPAATAVLTDPRRHHITVGTAADPAQVTFCDLGPVLHLWSGQGAELTPHVARMLAEHLSNWAAKADARPATIGAPNT